MADSDAKLDFSKITEGDVETQVVLPLLTDSHLLGIPKEWIHSKKYIRPLTIGKGSKKIVGFYPDYLIIVNAIPLAVIEVKSPQESVDTAYDEATAYALELNRKYRHGVNPCKIVIGCNGDKISIGYWDDKPRLIVPVAEINTGSSAIDSIRELISKGGLESFSNATEAKLNLNNFKRPSSKTSGESMIFTKISQNSFASQISPLLIRYFSSQPSGESSEIWTKGYISSNETTSYDKNLESLLKDRIATANHSGKIVIKTSKKKERELGGTINKFIKTHKGKHSGTIQIITGSVGAGKSLFIRRYKEHLQLPETKAVTHWAFIDFNNTPSGLNTFESWACEQFLTSLVAEGAKFDLNKEKDQEKIFAPLLHERGSFYRRRNKIKANEGEVEKARDIEAWRLDSIKSAESVSRYLQGDAGKTIVIVFDNVDKKGADEQLQIFQLAMWLKEITSAFVIIQMRDVTFEQYKYEPPLDTFTTGPVFHITPPRFIDVVKKRLQLSFDYLESTAPDILEFTTETGNNVQYPKENARKYLETIYSQIFSVQQNIARLLEALSNRNVRYSLDMFMNILISGHMTKGNLGERAISGKDFFVQDHILIRTLMRSGYQFYHDKSGFIANLFYCENTWKRPSNFHIIEILFFLICKSKATGDNGLTGYLSFPAISEELARKGMTKKDVYEACFYARRKGLIEADDFSIGEILDKTCFKVTASGFIHMRILSEEVEYLSAVIYSTPLNDSQFADDAYEHMRTENSFKEQYVSRKIKLTKLFYGYLKKQVKDVTKLYVGFDPEEPTGAKYILDKVKKSYQKLEQEHPNSNNYVEDLLDNIDRMTK